MNLRHMEVFHAIMRTGSVTGAARALNVTQPAVSAILKHCEGQLRMKLFARVSGRLQPTAEAKAIFPEVDAIFGRVDAVNALTQDLVGGRLGTLSIAAAFPIANGYLAKAVATFVAERADPEKPGAARPVTVDDASSALMRFAAGPRGVLEMARSCVRRPCDFTVEANGTQGTLRFDYARLNELQYGDGGDAAGLYGMRRIRAEHPSHPYAASWWPIGQGVGYGSSFVNQFADLLQTWPEGPWDPDFRQGLAVQAVCDAMERAAAERRWVRIEEIVSP